jgi:hypothetical protein
MKYLKLFENFEVTNVSPNYLDVIIQDEEFTFEIFDGDVFFSTDEEQDLAEQLGIILDDKLKSEIINQHNIEMKKTKMQRFGFFKIKESIKEFCEIF